MSRTVEILAFPIAPRAEKATPLLVAALVCKITWRLEVWVREGPVELSANPADFFGDKPEDISFALSDYFAVPSSPRRGGDGDGGGQKTTRRNPRGISAWVLVGPRSKEPCAEKLALGRAELPE